MCTKDTGKTPFLSGCPSMWPICNRGEEGTCIDMYIHIYIDVHVYTQASQTAFIQKQQNGSHSLGNLLDSLKQTLINI